MSLSVVCGDVKEENRCLINAGGVSWLVQW